MADSISVKNIEYHIRQLEKAGGHYSRVNFTPGNDSAAAYIKRVFESIPNIPEVKLDTFYIESANSPYNSKPLTNISVYFEGKNHPDAYYLIGAHYDASASRMGTATWNAQWTTINAPGADDNATGIACLFEMARILSDTSFNFQLDYSIMLVAFGAEESGPAYSGSHHGSVHCASTSRTKGDSILGMVSIDMIGYNNSHDYTAIVSDSVSSEFALEFFKANDDYSIGLIMNESSYINPSATYSDHLSFWLEDYKAILFIENAPPWNNSDYYVANPFYHKTSDTAGTVNMGLTKKVAQVNFATILTLCAEEMQVGVNGENEAPRNFALHQNYPNPFNATTMIKFELRENSYVCVKVFDAIGKEIAVLTDSHLEKGVHYARLTLNDASSGVYFIRLEANGKSETVKALYLK